MARTAHDSGIGIPSTGDLDLTVPALAPYLAVVRTATAGLAARLQLNSDEIEDLRIAVDEACVMVLALPRPKPAKNPTSLTCRFRVLPDALAVTISAPVGPNAALPPEKSFVWDVLHTHAADVKGIVDGGTATVELRKPRR
jgi:serine/threonine-protein kinase RsbW